MNKKLELRNKKIVYCFKIVIIVSALAFTLTTFSSLFNKKSDYIRGDIKNTNDTGYTEYSSGWPNRFYSYRTSMSDDKPEISRDEIDWNSFIIDMFFFSIPASVIFVGSTNVLRNLVDSSNKKQVI